MSYTHHVFISYRRTPTIAYWVEKYFHPRFDEWLKEYATAKATVFLDVVDIDTGDKWRKRISGALRGSCVLVPVYSPTYFESPYCWAELLTFQDREKLSPEDRSDLIVPVVACKGDNFPDSALDPQHLDLSKFVTKSGAFEDTADFKRFEDQVKVLAANVFKKLKRVPDPSDTWPVVDPDGDRAKQLARDHEAIVGLPMLAA